MTLINGTTRYNYPIIDLYDRGIVASKNNSFITNTLAVRTLEKALPSAKAIPQNLILHSNQGSQFTSAEFIQHCRELRISQSMNRAGCPYDNVPMERNHNTLKTALAYTYRFGTAAEPDYAISELLYDWYNQIRPHSYNGHLTPFEKRAECTIKQWCYEERWPLQSYPDFLCNLLTTKVLQKIPLLRNLVCKKPHIFGADKIWCVPKSRVLIRIACPVPGKARWPEVLPLGIEFGR